MILYLGAVGSDTQKKVLASEAVLKKVYKAFKGIVKVSEGKGVDKPKESVITLASGIIGVNDAKN
ncbi:hypothetical protein [Borrelia crocidurae]|uniref:Variable large protein n=1 Tax=Borrelia crocidurae (strain Achema) TaxID=1155096 RepID=I0FFI7_BORCA|nr:hypothetical protein [Borrelia crocidurae]AFI32243.1 hypothetical protein Q7M_1417 [Borrelia crocidurae str. Achema]